MSTTVSGVLLGLTLGLASAAGQTLPTLPVQIPGLTTQAVPSPAAPATSSSTIRQGPREITLTEMPGHLERALGAVRRINRKGVTAAADEIGVQLPQLASGLRRFAEISRQQAAENPASSNVGVERGLWGYARRTLSGWQATSFTSSKTVETLLSTLEGESRLLARAREQFESQQAHSGLIATIDRAQEQVTQGLDVARARQNTLLVLQSDLTELEIEAGMVEEELREASATARSRLLKLDAPPIWRATEATPRVLRTPVEENEKTTPVLIAALGFFGVYLAELLTLHVITYVIFLVPLLLLRKRAAAWPDPGEQWQRDLREVMRRPYSAALLPSFIVSGIWLGEAQLESVFLILPLLRILPIYLRRRLKSGTWALAGFFLFDWAQRSYIPAGPLWVRVVGLAQILVTIAALMWLQKRLRAAEEPTIVTRMWLVGIGIGEGLVAAAAVSNIAGAIALSRYLETGVVSTIYGAALLYGFIQICDAFFQLILLANAQLEGRGSSVRLPAELASRLSVGMNWLAVIFFWFLTVRAFQLTDPFLALGRATISHRFSIGTFDFTLSSIFIVFATLAAAMIVSRVIRFFLAAGVYDRFDLQRGTGEIISKLVHYTLLTGAFLFALSATGIDLNKFTILVGALGVGLGFGLQNIVGNFICGLILLFERPLAVGDSVDVGGITGSVIDIGIRATRIRTWDNAVVAVPNSNLVSGQFTNWRSVNERRGSQLVVGVATGSEPQRVIQVLEEVATQHPLVLEYPRPEGFFTGFAENSIGFSLRYWSLVRDRQKVDSDMYTAVSQRLLAEGIEMPRTQRDLYIRDAAEQTEKA